MADASMPLERVQDIVWDAIVVGTGMGGGTLGYALARSGHRVLFVERGHSPFGERSRAAILGMYPEQVSDGSRMDERARCEVLARAGRSQDVVIDASARKTRSFVPFIGSGVGGSSALYGMVCERLFEADFAPREHHAGAAESTLPEAWPISYEALIPHYEAAESLFQVHGGVDPLRPAQPSRRLPQAPPFSPPVAMLADVLSSSGMHPYSLPMACAFVPECATCQGYLCPRQCKGEPARLCVAPALSQYGAQLLSDCTVLSLEAGPTRIESVICESRGRRMRLRAKLVVLAAGALFTPALLLRSRSQHWPHGLANRSDQVGRNLMRHLIELFKLPADHGPRGQYKELGFNDFYQRGRDKLGTVQSFGSLPPLEVATTKLGMPSWLKRPLQPVLQSAWERYVEPGMLLSAIMEDLPYADNRVLPDQSARSDGRQQCSIQYRIHDYDAQRLARFVRSVTDVLSPLRPRALTGMMNNNEALAHACGTCRFGADPRTSVLDASNRAHDVDNLYVVDASFFPSSGGVNPSLTIAANALRVAGLLSARL